MLVPLILHEHLSLLPAVFARVWFVRVDYVRLEREYVCVSSVSWLNFSNIHHIRPELTPILVLPPLIEVVRQVSLVTVSKFELMRPFSFLVEAVHIGLFQTVRA